MEAALLADCVAAPDDDAPRLVWADAVGGERGELVVLQCDLARGGLTPNESGRRRRRVRELLTRRGERWSGLRGLVDRCIFRRGFVDAVLVDAERFVKEAANIFAAAPLLTSIAVRGLKTAGHGPAIEIDASAARLLASVITMIAKSRVSVLDLHEGIVTSPGLFIQGETQQLPYTRELFGRLRDSGLLARLRAFGSDALFRGDLDALRSLDASQLERCRVRDTAIAFASTQPSGVASTTTLSLSGLDVDTDFDRLPSATTELRISAHRHAPCDPYLAALGRHPIARQIERLAIRGVMTGAGLDAFARFPTLVSLDLGNASLATHEAKKQESPIERLCELDIPALRELRVFSNLQPGPLEIWAKKLAPQLELLDLRPSSALTDQIPIIDGDVATMSPISTLLTAGDRAPEPWWDRVAVLMRR